VHGQVTFLYFNDVEAAGRFYGETLGLAKTFDLGWVKIFSLSPTSSVGLVDGKSGAHRPAAEKPVMVSLVVDDVEGWYEFLKGRGISLGEPPSDAKRAPIRAFTSRTKFVTEVGLFPVPTDEPHVVERDAVEVVDRPASPARIAQSSRRQALATALAASSGTATTTSPASVRSRSSRTSSFPFGWRSSRRVSVSAGICRRICSEEPRMAAACARIKDSPRSSILPSPLMYVCRMGPSATATNAPARRGILLASTFASA
ncbi:MAG: hypothetical protein HC868_18100, partial [Sphingomonadales bacterium]|nr:hypothetical protein [Sphingomonadales bacterium]